MQLQPAYTNMDVHTQMHLHMSSPTHIRFGPLNKKMSKRKSQKSIKFLQFSLKDNSTSPRGNIFVHVTHDKMLIEETIATKKKTNSCVLRSKQIFWTCLFSFSFSIQKKDNKIKVFFSLWYPPSLLPWNNREIKTAFCAFLLI